MDASATSPAAIEPIPRETTKDNGRILAAEMVGTAVLIIGGPGTAILAGDIGQLGISLAFGFSLLVMVYVIGPISGCHINPAVTLGLFIAKKIDAAHAVFALIGQVIGGIAGAAIVFGIANGQDNYERGQFAANLWSGEYFGLGSTIVVEIVMTALLVLVVLFTTTNGFIAPLNGVAAGLTLALIHMVSIPVDNTSVNPIRSLATALFADTETEALQQVWAFILFPLIGAVVAVVVFLALAEARLEDTLLADVPGALDIRDQFEIGAGEIVDSVEDAVTPGPDAGSGDQRGQ